MCQFWGGKKKNKKIKTKMKKSRAGSLQAYPTLIIL
jgi:hypothetical protein